MQKCKYCGSNTEERLQSGIKVDPYYSGDYGDYEHFCDHCGALGTEIFGHGIRWTPGGNFVELKVQMSSNKGWICPRCNKVLNPNMKYCNCK